MPHVVPMKVPMKRSCRQPPGAASPDADVDAVRSMGVGARLDQRVVYGRPPFAFREPIEKSLAHTRSNGIELGVRTEIVLFEWILREIE